MISVLKEWTDAPAGVQRLYAQLFDLIEAELRRAEFVGPLGIDAFVYRTPEGRFRLKPLVEINPRHTMGRLTLELMQHTCPGSCGEFRLVSIATAQREGYESLAAYARYLVERFPVRLGGNPVPRIREGALCLNDPAVAQRCLAIFRVSSTPLVLVKSTP